MSVTRSRQCSHTKADGTRCRANVIAGSDRCFFHDPAKTAERQAAQQAGGRAGKTAVLPPDTPDVPLSSVSDLIAFLGQTINQVRRGDIEPRVSNAVGYLTATLLRALEQGDVEKRLAELEAIVKGQDASESPFDRDLEDEAPENIPGRRAST